MRKISKWKKFKRVVRRKLFKPMLYAVAASFVIYAGVSNIVTEKRNIEPTVPQFKISSISDRFDETEFMHLLLTIQEINRLPLESAELYDFVNGAFPTACPKLLKVRLDQMNWEPQAFLIRVKKLFAMYDIYDRVSRLDNTIAFLSTEIEENRLPYELRSQVRILQQERDKIIGSDITPAEYNFMKEYAGFAQRLKKL